MYLNSNFAENGNYYTKRTEYKMKIYIFNRKHILGYIIKRIDAFYELKAIQSKDNILYKDLKQLSKRDILIVIY